MVFIRVKALGVGLVQLCSAQNTVENPPGSRWGEPRGNFELLLHEPGGDGSGSSKPASLEDIFSDSPPTDGPRDTELPFWTQPSPGQEGGSGSEITLIAGCWWHPWVGCGCWGQAGLQVGGSCFGKSRS